MFATYTQAPARALENLRNTGHFSWYLVPILAPCGCFYCFYFAFCE